MTHSLLTMVKVEGGYKKTDMENVIGVLGLIVLALAVALALGYTSDYFSDWWK